MFDEYTKIDLSLINGGLSTACLAYAKLVPVFKDKKPTDEIDYCSYDIILNGANSSPLNVRLSAKSLAIDPAQIAEAARKVAYIQVTFRDFEFKQYVPAGAKKAVTMARASEIIISPSAVVKS